MLHRHLHRDSLSLAVHCPPGAMDLLSASVEKLEPLPAAASASGNHGNHEADAAWLEEMEEWAQRGEGRGGGASGGEATSG